MGDALAMGVADAVTDTVAELVGDAEVVLGLGPGDAAVEHPTRPRQVRTVSILLITMTTPRRSSST